MPILFSYWAMTFFCLALFLNITASVLLRPNYTIILEWNLEQISCRNLNFPLIIDKAGVFFSRIVLFISGNVLFFSNSYIDEEKRKNRFLILILLFILSMNILIFIPRLLFLLLGWDGLGLVRYILVIHYNRPKSLAAGFTTVMTNRIGDALIILSIPLLYSSMNFNPSIYNYGDYSYKVVIIVMITLAAMTKRAQIPFSSWLPAAIAAPTPISALVHSSTLVTAGVFLIYRFYPILIISTFFSLTLLIFSCLTITIAGIIAFKENDIKKIIALSTLSQLGVMIYRLSINLPELAFAHILTHATFKALLFISAGDVIIQVWHTQDLRQFGNLFKSKPIILSVIIVTNLRLVGFPFLAGFYSKDLIIELSLFRTLNFLIFTLLMLSTSLTLLYSIRFIYFIFFKTSNRLPIQVINSKDKNINIPYAVITFYVLIRGPIILWNFLFPYIHPPITASFKLLTPIMLTIVFIFILVLKYHNRCGLGLLPKKLFFLLSIWFINFVNTQFFLKLLNKGGYLRYSLSDSGWNELTLGKGVASFINISSSKFTKWQNSFITLNFILILIIILYSLYFNSLNKASFWRYENDPCLKINFNSVNNTKTFHVLNRVFFKIWVKSQNRGNNFVNCLLKISLSYVFVSNLLPPYNSSFCKYFLFKVFYFYTSPMARSNSFIIYLRDIIIF